MLGDTAARFSERSVDRALEARPVRAVPVHTPAQTADLKMFVVLPRPSRQHRFNGRLRCVLKLAVATKAARERLERQGTVPL
jgi:hypothetical protein